MTEKLAPSAQKVQDAILARGVPCQVVEMPASTRSAAEAAQAVGCQVEQIVKSLVFVTKNSHKALLVLASGANRVDEKALSAEAGEKVGKADADFVREVTGFAIGGIPPLGHNQPLETYIDEDLMQYGEIWAAAGTPNAVFQLTPADLLKICDGKVIRLKQVKS